MNFQILSTLSTQIENFTNNNKLDLIYDLYLELEKEWEILLILMKKIEI